MTGEHTLAHALDSTDCRHDMRDITHCVICERRLDPARTQVDTCGAVCRRQLGDMQANAALRAYAHLSF